MRQNIANVKARATARITSSSRACYIGGQGDSNLGDEAMLEAARRLLPGVDLIDVVYPNQERRLARLSLSGAPFFDFAILGGGTLINHHWHEKVQTALAQGLPIFCLGTGVGSAGFGMAVQTDAGDWKPLLQQFAGIGVRGPRSEARLRSLGLGRVEIIGDLALTLTPETLPKAGAGKFVVNVTAPPGDDPGNYARVNELEGVIKKLTVDGWTAVPVAMHRNDIEPLKQLMERATGKKYEILMPPTAQEFFDILTPCAFTLAVRLHAAILSCCVGVPPLMLGYRDKCLDFMESIDLEEWHINVMEAPEGLVTERSLALADSASKLRQPIHSSCLKWRGRIEQYVDTTIKAVRTGQPNKEHART